MKLEIKDFSLNYFGHQDSLHSIDYTFNAGVNVVFGVNGSGKTSLLKGIAGVNYVHTGSFTLNDEDITLDKNSKISFVFDDLGFFERRTLRYNLYYPLKLRKVPKDMADAMVNEWMHKFELSEYILDTPIFRLSADDRAKAALIRGFYRNSQVIIFDNPLSRLNPTQRRYVFNLLAKHMLTAKGIVIYATDSVEEVTLLNSQTLVLSYGYKVENGIPDSFISSPKCLSTSEYFIPYLNKRIVTIKENGFELFGENYELDLNNTQAQTFIGKEVVLAFKPTAVVEGKLNAEKIISLNTINGEVYLLKVGNEEIYSASNLANVDIDLKQILLFDITSEKLIYSKK